MTTVELGGGGDDGAEAAAEAVEAAAEAVEAAAEAVEATAEAAADVAEEASEAPAEPASGDVELHERVKALEIGLQSHIDNYEVHQTRSSVEFEAEMAAHEAVADVVEVIAEAAEVAEETAEGTAEEITVVEPDVAASTERKGGGLMGVLRRIY